MPEKVNLLVVDDDANSLTAIELALSELGQNVVKASSGEEALRRLQKEDYALVILDVNMPTMTGFEVADLIRSRDRLRQTPVIFLSGEEKIAFRGYLKGAVDYLIKPVDPEILRAKAVVFIELALARHELIDQVAALEHARTEIGELNQVLRRRAEELQTAYREMESFSYSVSHDLQAPLRAIKGFSGILAESAGTALDEECQLYLKKIGDAVGTMERLIAGLLDLSRVGRKELVKNAVDLGLLVKEVVQQLSIPPERKVVWNCADLPVVEGDTLLLRQVLMNLLSNAVKFCQSREVCEITIGTQNGGPPEETVFFVRDNGVGFDPKYAHRLFGVFQRLHGPQFEGTGIGLSVAQRIIQRHGGRIWAEGNIDQGATFYFSLPKGK